MALTVVTRCLICSHEQTIDASVITLSSFGRLEGHFGLRALICDACNGDVVIVNSNSDEVLARLMAPQEKTE